MAMPTTVNFTGDGQQRVREAADSFLLRVQSTITRPSWKVTTAPWMDEQMDNKQRGSPPLSSSLHHFRTDTEPRRDEQLLVPEEHLVVRIREPLASLAHYLR